MQNRTKNFMFRVGDENDVEGWQKVDQLRKAVKKTNELIKEEFAKSEKSCGQNMWFMKPTTLRVCLKGRKPKKKFAYKQFDWTTNELKTTYRGFTGTGEVLGGRDNWGACDVYVQRRFTEEYRVKDFSKFANEYHKIISASFSE